jgi:hypothetical protein
MENLVTSGDVNYDAENAFFIEEPSHVDLERRRGLGLLPFVVAGFGLACTLGLAAAVAVGVRWRMDEIRQRQHGFEVEPIASPADLAPPPAAEPPEEPAEPSEVVPAAELVPEPVAPPVAPTVRPTAPEPASDLARVEVFSVESEGASRLRVRCGEVSVTGTDSVRITDFPAGFCTIEVHQFDDIFRMGLGVEEAKSLRCGVEDGALRCS